VKIRYSKDALKFLGKQSRKNVERIREAILRLTETPPQGDVAILQGFEDGRKRLRIGAWRVIYRVDSENNLDR